MVREYLEHDLTLGQKTDLSVDNICERLALCLETTYFSYRGGHYVQLLQHACAMGSPVSPIVVNLYMDKFEQQAVREYPGTTTRIWLRYVDDTFVVVKRPELDQFVQLILQS